MNKKTLIILLAIGIFFLILWAKFVSLAGLIGILKDINYAWIIIGILFYILGILMRAYRWKLLLKHLKDISTTTSFHLYLSGQMFNYLIPLRLGEIAKVVFLKQKKGVKITRSFPTIIIDKVLDLLVLLIVVFILLALVQNATRIPLVWAFIILVIGGLAFLAYTIKNEKPFLKILNTLLFFAPRIRESIRGHAKAMIKELRNMNKKTGLLITTFLISIICLLFDVAFFYSMLKATGFSAPLLYAFFGYTLIIVSYTIPTPPAQLGSNEILYLIIFSVLLGLDKTAIAAVTVLVHAITTLILVLGGIASMRALHINAKELLESKTYTTRYKR